MAPPAHNQSHLGKDRLLQIRLNADKWHVNARNNGLISPSQQLDPHRSQGATSGVSVDWLRQFSDSLKELPLLPTETYSVVRDIVTFVTSEQACRLVDVIPQEHVGYPSHYICHNWNGDFHELVNVLVSDFSKRWTAHLAYKFGKGREWKSQLEGEKEDEEAGIAAALAMERKKLAGYYVWLDVAAINQHNTNQMDPGAVSRLITVIGRTVLVLDEEASVLTRLWCCYELWTTIKCQRTVRTLRIRSEANGEVRDKDDDDEQEEEPEDVADRLPQLDLSSARTSMSIDKSSIMASLQQDLVSPKVKVKNLEDIGNQVRQALVRATVRELLQPDLLARVYGGLGQCCKVYTDSNAQPGFSQVDSVRKALRELIDEHYYEECARAKLLPQEDPELETWECLSFLEKEFAAQREDDFWLQDVKRFCKLTLHSYATRFSNGYVNNLLRQAGTCDNMRVLSQYVHSQCRVKTIGKWGAGS